MKKILAVALIAASFATPAFAKGQKVDRTAVLNGAALLAVASDVCPELGLDSGKVKVFAAIAFTQVHASEAEVIGFIADTRHSYKVDGKATFCKFAAQAAIKSGIGVYASR